MLRHGIPRDVVTALRAVSRSFRGWGGSTKVTRALRRRRGARVPRPLACWSLHRPGHSPSDTVFWDAERRIALVGDHLIAHISSNPLISRPLGGKSGDPGNGVRGRCSTYLRSLRETREMPAELLLPGHGDPVCDHVALIDERFACPRAARGASIAGLIAAEPAHRVRDRAGDVGQRRGHPGLPRRSPRSSATSTCSPSAARSPSGCSAGVVRFEPA